jgi:hypothetical protein
MLPNSKEAASFRTLARALMATLPKTERDLGVIEEVLIDEPSAA